MIGRAATSLARHALLFIGLAVAASGSQALIYRLWPNNAVLFGTGIVATALAAAVIYAFTLADVDGAPASFAWSRALERGWAVIVVSLLQNFFVGVGLSLLSLGDVLDRVAAVVALLAAVCINFSDVAAVVTEEESVLILLPQAFIQSVRAVWTRWTMVWAISLVLAEILVDGLGVKLHPIARETIDTFFFVPIAVLSTYVYLDAIGYESKRSCSQ